MGVSVEIYGIYNLLATCRKRCGCRLVFSVDVEVWIALDVGICGFFRSWDRSGDFGVGNGCGCWNLNFGGRFGLSEWRRTDGAFGRDGKRCKNVKYPHATRSRISRKPWSRCELVDTMVKHQLIYTDQKTAGIVEIWIKCEFNTVFVPDCIFIWDCIQC